MAKTVEYASFRWWQTQGGHFAKALTEAFMRADNENLRRLASEFPQMAAAHKEHHWETAPEGFGEYPSPESQRRMSVPE